MELGYMLDSSTLEPSTQLANICEIPTKLSLSVYKDYCKGDLSTHLANLPATLQRQSELHYAESFKAWAAE